MKKLSFTERWYSAVIIVLIAVYVFGWFYSMHLAVLEQERGSVAVMPVVTGDSQDYAGLAQSLLSGNGFRAVSEQSSPVVPLSQLPPETFRTPGYPAFVGLLSLSDGGSYFAVTLVQILLVFITAFCIQRLGSLFFSDSIGMLAAVLFLLDPEVFFLSQVILSDILFVFLFILGFYLLVAYLHKRPVTMTIISAILFSFAVYVRPMGVFALPVFVAPVIISRATARQKLYSAIAIVLIVCAALVPWMYRNYRETGVFAFSSLRAYNFASYNVPLFLASKGIPESQTFAAIQQQSGVPMSEWRNLADSSALNKVTDAILLARPFSYLTYHVAKTIVGSFGSSIDSFISGYDHIVGIASTVSPIAPANFTHGIHRATETLTQTWWRILEGLFWLVLYILMILALVAYRRRRSVWTLFLVPLYILLLVGPAFLDVRYRVPAEPFIFLLAVAGAAMLVSTHERWSIVPRYLISGVTGLATNIGCLFIFVHFFGWWYLIGSIAALVVASTVGFTMQKFWTFRERSAEIIHRQFVVYFAIATFNLFLNTGLVYLFTSILGVWYIASQVVVSASIGVSSFFLYRLIVFKKSAASRV